MKRRTIGIFLALQISLLIVDCGAKNGTLEPVGDGASVAASAKTAESHAENSDSTKEQETETAAESGSTKESEVMEETVTIYVKESMAFYRNDGTLTYKETYEYDSNGNCVLTERFNSEDKLMFRTEETYDEEGRLLVLHQEDADGRLKSHGEYAYDEHGFLQKDTWYGANKEVMSWNEYTVDEEGRYLQYFHYGSDGKLSEHTEYNWNGERLESIGFVNQEGAVTWLYEYDYDDVGNCISFLSYNPGSDDGNRYDFYYEDGLMSAWDYGSKEGRSTYGEYAYLSLEVSKEAAERYYEKKRRNPGEI